MQSINPSIKNKRSRSFAKKKAKIALRPEQIEALKNAATTDERKALMQQFRSAVQPPVSIFLEGIGEVPVYTLEGSFFSKLKKLKKQKSPFISLLQKKMQQQVTPLPSLPTASVIHVEGIGEVPVYDFNSMGNIFTDIKDGIVSIFKPAGTTTAAATTTNAGSAVDMTNNTAQNPNAAAPTEQNFFQKYKMPLLIGGAVCLAGVGGYFLLKDKK